MARSRSLTMVGLVTGAILVGIVGSWTTAGSSSAPAAATGAGLTYGGRLGGGNDVWLRLRPDRHRIVSLLIEWSVPASMCTKPDVAEEYRSSSTWTGSEAGHPIDVRNGRLVARTSDAYSYGPYSFVEKVRITGVFVSQRVEGTLDVNLVATNRDGAGGFSCTLVRKRWTAVD